MVIRIFFVFLFSCTALCAKANDAFSDAATTAGVDKRLLIAIADVESRRHPWTLNIDGDPFSFDSKKEALTFYSRVRQNPWLLTVSNDGGAKSRMFFTSRQTAQSFAAKRRLEIFDLRHINPLNTDVGIMQINLRAHGHRFSSVSQLIDLDYNISYAAQFLSDLARKHGWQKAIALYHSPTPSRQRAYVAKVRQAYAKLLDTESTV